MLIITSPTKTQSFDFGYELPDIDFSQPEFLDQAEKIINILQEKSVDELQEILDISEDLAKQNYERFQSWRREHNKNNSKPALFTYQGDVFQELSLEDYTKDQFNYSDENLRIITAFYGVLHGMSLMQQYRLEMKHKINLDGENKKMNKFWQDTLTEHLNKEAEKHSHDYLLNLASNQYARAINFRKLNMDVVDVDFKEIRDGEYKSIAIYIKKARGKMIDYCIRKEISKPNELKNFSQDGYEFKPEESEENSLFFARES